MKLKTSFKMLTSNSDVSFNEKLIELMAMYVAYNVNKVNYIIYTTLC